MLNTLGLIAGNVLNLPGILGLALGMTTRNPLVGVALGALVGLASIQLFADAGLAHAETAELVIAPLVGALAGGLGSLIRRRGATV